jgi:hypothetical protein
MPCVRCITASAIGAVLESEFGAGKVNAITLTSSTALGVTRRWERIADCMKEVGNARVWRGVHYRSTEVGERMGGEIGRLVVASIMRPTLR